MVEKSELLYREKYGFVSRWFCAKPQAPEAKTKLEDADLLRKQRHRNLATSSYAIVGCFNPIEV